jgi:hypothetical protein
MTVPDILEAVGQIFDGMGLSVVVGVLVAVSLAQFIYHRFIREFLAHDREWAEHMDRKVAEYSEKPKNDDQNLALLDAPEKPKNMFVRLGDDGELVEWSEK